MWMAECAGRHGLLKGGEIPRGETPLLDALQVDGSSSEVSVLSDGRRTGLAATCGSESLYPLLYYGLRSRWHHVFFIFINATDGSNYILHIQVSPDLETVWGCWGLTEITRSPFWQYRFPRVASILALILAPQASGLRLWP
jgi:hypothetical protein